MTGKLSDSMNCCERILHWLLNYTLGGAVYLAGVIAYLIGFYILMRILEWLGMSTDDAGSLAAALAIATVLIFTLSMIIP